MNIRGPADLEERIEFYKNQNELLKKKLKQIMKFPFQKTLYQEKTARKIIIETI